jgi:hypothetical protein
MRIFFGECLSEDSRKQTLINPMRSRVWREIQKARRVFYKRYFFVVDFNI